MTGRRRPDSSAALGAPEGGVFLIVLFTGRPEDGRHDQPEPDLRGLRWFPVCEAGIVAPPIAFFELSLRPPRLM